MRRLWIILIVLALGLCVGVGLFIWLPTTPVGTMHQVKSAVQAHNWAAFTAVVDVDSVADNAARDIAAIAQETMARKNLSKILSKGLSALIAIKVRTSLSADLKNWVTGENPGQKGILSAILPKVSEGATLRLKSIRWWGDTGQARVSVGPESVLTLELSRLDNTWRVTRVLNVRELYEQSRKNRTP